MCFIMHGSFMVPGYNGIIGQLKSVSPDEGLALFCEIGVFHMSLCIRLTVNEK